MRITDIKANVNDKSRVSVYIDNKFAFALNQQSLLASKIYKSEEIDAKRLAELKKLADFDKLYFRTLTYVTSRLKTRWQVKVYLEKKDASPALIEAILNKLSDINLIDDYNYALSYISDRNQLRPTSLTKIKFDLLKKHIDSNVVVKAIEDSDLDNSSSLRQVIATKRRQLRYKDDQKLMQYLARQGYNYGEIKEALQENLES